ncbi:MAG: UDP-N-acetylmuramoyl-L-alanyl-D-glutamate--2,6-diaminopimelate ligase [Aeromicrobium sp.]|nr:MAG: UDP-N-acetylmuramoyl-L-alanyl-D-glutamate--2,6-diaminopimelate ligase [Aeromicrobium sp.]
MQHMRTRPATMPHVKLSHVAKLVGAEPAPGHDTKISGITLSSSNVQPGDLFVAAPGASAHGIRFLESAVAAGARAVLTDHAGALAVGTDFPLVIVESPRQVVAKVAAALYEQPSDAFMTFGVTGTQGKTTATHLAEAAFGSARSAVVGTIGTRIGGVPAKSALTTPEAPELQALFAVMREELVEACFMEVSSHALVQGRVDGFVFDVAVFLNLGRDHLDFHADLEDYFAAKSLLFTPAHARVGVVNVDDEFGRRLVETATIPITSFSIDGHDATWRATDIRETSAGSDVNVSNRAGESFAFHIPIPGRFNVSNAVAMVAAMSIAGIPPSELAAGIAASAGVPGRMERIANDRDIDIVVDYAHKPDAIRAILAALRPVTDGKLIMVMGAGGDRDQGKRPIMGQLAAEFADLVIVTDDNPRSEDPSAIRREVIAGVQGDCDVVEIGDRREAIAYALGRAQPGDTVVVAGKGHESGQEVAGIVYPFDDRVVLREELARLS